MAEDDRPNPTPAPERDGAPTPTAPSRRPRRLRRWLLGLGAVVAALVLLAVAGLWWVLRSESGTTFALERLPGVTVVRPHGRFLGDFGADELRVRFGDGGELRLVQVGWTRLAVGRSGGPGWARVAFDTLSAEAAWLTLPKPQQTTRTPPPTELQLPVELIVRQLRIGALHMAPLGDQPLRELRAQVHLGADDGRLHRLDGLSVARGPLSASGQAHVGALAPMPADIRLQLQQAAVAQWPAWAATLNLKGPLAESTLTGRLQARTEPAQTLTVDAVLRPFAEWPLGRLNAQARDLDVAALLAGGPQTALNGRIEVAEANAEQPLQASVDLTNAAAGPWNAGRVPVRAVALTLQADPRDRNQLQLPRLRAELGTREEAAGVVQGGGRWTPAGWSLQAALQDIRPERLDARAAPMVLGGQLQAQGVGFGGGGVGPPPTERVVDTSATLTGRWPDRPRAPPLTLTLAGRYATDDAGRQQVLLRDLRAVAGAARAEVTGSAVKASASAPWTVDAQLALRELDLQPWWPGPADAPLRRSPSRITANGQVQLTVPAAGPAGDVFAWLATLQGRAGVQLAPSLLAGLPVSGEASLQGRGDAQGLQLALSMDAAGNALRAEGRVAPEAARDRWQLRIDAPALQRLNALAQGLAPAGAQAPPAFGGSVRGDLLAEGRWPHLRTQGQLAAQQLAWPGLRLAEGQARWQAGTARGAPLDLDVVLADLTLTGADAARQVPRLTLRVDGRADAHRLALQAELAGAPPQRSDPARTPRPQPGPLQGPRTVARLTAEGGLLYGAAAPGEPAGLAIAGWRGRLQELDARAPGAREPLLRTAGVDLEARTATAQQPARLQVQPGRLVALGGALQWSRLRWQGAHGSAPMQVEADAVLEPLQVVPLAQRLQPGLDLRGDLVVEGRVSLRSAPVLRLDLALQRRGGDLSMDTGGRVMRLGLSEMRLDVRADGARWSGQAALAGSAFGSVRADLGLRTAGPQAWPAADSALQGDVQLRVADLGVYEPWLPVGWRLDGRVVADARLGGTLGAPQWQGRVQGDQLALSNVLEGVRVRDGELRATLAGDRARIERFTARAGDGVLRVDGGAELGASPTALLNIVAEDFRALGRVDRRIDLNGRAQVRLDAQRIAVEGRFEVDDGLIDLGASAAPALSSDVVVVDDEAARQRAAAKAQPKAPARAVQMDVRVSLGDDLRVRGRGVNTRVAGDLRVTAPGGQLAVDGTVRTVDGTYEAYGTKLAIERGVITLAGAPTNPRLDILAMRTDLEDIRVGVSITGTAQNPRVQLTSTPSLSEMDKLSYLTMGRPSASLAGDQTAVLQRAAMALWQGDRAQGPGFAQRVGLDKLTVRRGESGGVDDAVVSLGKQVSDRLYVGYQQSLDATGGSWELIYRIAQRFTVRVQTGETTVMDVIWTWLWG